MNGSQWFSKVAVIAVVALVVLTSVYAAEDNERKLTKNDLPAAVLAAFEQSYPKASIESVSTETEDSTMYYEINSKDGKVKRDLLYAVDGTVKEVEESVKSRDLPGTVMQAVEKAFPKGKIKKAEKLIKGGVTSFELVVKSGKEEFELALSTDGTITKNEKQVKSEDKEDQKDKD
jgi:hypothetical protein